MLNHDEILAMCDRYFPGLIFTKDSEPHYVNQIYRAVIEGNDIHFRLDITVTGAIAEICQSGRVTLMRSPNCQGLTLEQALTDVRRQWDKYLHRMVIAIQPAGGVE